MWLFAFSIGTNIKGMFTILKALGLKSIFLKSLCTQEELKWIQDIEVDSSKCLEQCSGILVTSYKQQEIENEKSFFNTFILKLTNHFVKNDPNEFKGLLFFHN